MLIVASGQEVKTLAAELTGLLATDTTKDSKQEVCRILWKYADEDNVTGIAPLLNNGDTAGMTRYALERMEGKIVDSAFMVALSSAPDGAKAGIINTLVSRKTTSAKSVIKMYVGHSNTTIAECATVAVSSLG